MTKLVQAKIKHQDEISRLYNLYRIFYKEEDDPSTIPNINPINDNIENINILCKNSG